MTSNLPGESTPLLSGGESQGHGAANEVIPITIRFDRNGDPDNPQDWSPRFKWGIVVLLTFTSFTVTFTCFSVVPVARHIVKDLDGGDAPASASVLLVTIWELGEAAGPLLIGPLSELTGRYPIMNVTNILFIMATILAAISKNIPLFITSRALTGMAVATNVLNPAIVGDMFPLEQRGTAISVIMFAPLLGSSVGSFLSGFITESWGWRCVIWVSVALAILCELAFYTFFRETYSIVILRKRLARLQKEAGDKPMACIIPEDCGLKEGSRGLGLSILRPAAVLFGSGVLATLGIFGAVVFAHIYVLSVTLPSILEDIYGLSPAEVGTAFLAQGFGSLLSVLICNFCLDRIYIKLRAANNGVGLPEHRLPMLIIGGLTLPPAVALYGWCAEYRLSLVLLLFSLICIRFSLFLVILPLMAYVVDATGHYSASALTGIIVLRCLGGAFLPLSIPPLIENLGCGWGFTVLASLGLVLVLIPMSIQRYGPQWRKHSKYTKSV